MQFPSRIFTYCPEQTTNFSYRERNTMPVDAISLEVLKNMFISVSEEMGVAL